MDTSLERADLLALDFDAGQVTGIVLIAIFGCILGALMYWDHRRTYRLSGCMPSASEILRPPRYAGAALSFFLVYKSWVRDWITPLAANITFGLVGGLAFVLAFGLAYWLTNLEIRYPEPLPVPYRFAKEELSVRPPLRKRVF